MNISAELAKFEAGSKEYIFFEKVFKKLGPNFICKSVEEKQREAHSKLSKAMEKYFQLHILVNAIIRSTEQRDKSQEGSLVLHSSNESSNEVHSLYLNSIQKYLPPEESSQELMLFGLTKANTLKECKRRKSESDNAAFKKQVEDNINEFCKKLILCTGGSFFSDSDWKNAFDGTMKDLESDAVFMSFEEAKEQSKKQLKEIINTYYEELSKGISLLSKTLFLHVQKIEFESSIAEFYLHQCRASYIKIKFLEIKVLTATYNQDTIPALKKISDQLDQSEAKLIEEKNAKTVSLESYLKLGENYEHLVDEYTQLTKSIKEVQWSIDELKSKKTQERTYAHN